MILDTTMLIVEKREKPYDVNGNTGISYKVRVLVGVDIFLCKTTKQVLDQIENEDSVRGKLKISSIKEVPEFELLSVEE